MFYFKKSEEACRQYLDIFFWYKYIIQIGKWCTLFPIHYLRTTGGGAGSLPAACPLPYWSPWQVVPPGGGLRVNGRDIDDHWPHIRVPLYLVCLSILAGRLWVLEFVNKMFFRCIPKYKVLQRWIVICGLLLPAIFDLFLTIKRVQR